MTDSERQRLRNEFQALQNKHSERHYLLKPPHLYHYTRFDSFLNIARNAQLWASDISHMSTDSADGVYRAEVIRAVTPATQLPMDIKDVILGSASQGLGELWFQYVACFSSTNTIESQWKAYAAESTGCAIEVSYDALFEAGKGGKYALAKMLYHREKQEEFLEQIVDKGLELRKELALTAADDVAFALELSMAFLNCGLTFKRPKYESEDEWRITMIDGDRTRAESRQNGKIHYRTVPLAKPIVRRVLRGSRCTHSVLQIQEALSKSAFAEVPVEESV